MKFTTSKPPCGMAREPMNEYPLVTGLRGSGKTVLLNAFADKAREHSWWVISETANQGFTQRIRNAALNLIAKEFSGEKRKISGLSFNGWGLQLSEATNTFTPEPTLRDALTALLDLHEELDAQLNQDPVGLLITVDELHYYRKEEVIEFATTIQHLVRENKNIAVAIAGIPQAIKPLLAGDAGNNPVTFLRRGNRIELGR